MIDIESFFSQPAYVLERERKTELLTTTLQKLTRYHYIHCEAYANILGALGMSLEKIEQLSLHEIPFIPTSAFKHLNLSGIAQEQVYKTIFSSGTSLGTKSRIVLDRHTANWQQKALVKLVQDFTGLRRSPMLVIAPRMPIQGNLTHSSEATLLLGFSLFGSEICFALNDTNELNFGLIEDFFTRHSGKTGSIIGLSFQIWQKFLMQLKNENIKYDLTGWTVIHGGGWKKLAEKAVDNQGLKDAFKYYCSINKVYNFYGMIEQTGNLFFECEYGYLHAGIFGDVLIRNATDFSVCIPHQTGIIQTLSVLAHSYSGHSVLTGDEGYLCGVDDCECGRKGKYFIVEGRIKDVEIKGCSNV